MRAILISLGGRGDTWPFISLGRALVERGHYVTLAANGCFRQLAHEHGLDFAEALPSDVYTDFAENLSHRSDLEAFRAMVDAYLGLIRSTYHLVMERYVAGQTVIAAQTYAIGARLAQEKHNLAMATIHVQPLWFRSAFDPLGFWRHLPRWVSTSMGRLIDYFVDRMIGPATNAFRDELGLPAVSRIIHRWWHSPQLVIGMFPSWFRAPQPDWPPHTRLAGFPQSFPTSEFDDAGLEDFLKAGPPPLVFNQSAIVGKANRYYDAALEAVERMRQRAIFIAPDQSQVPSGLPSSVKCFPYVPLQRLLPRAKAHIYHGGIGSMAMTLSAGIPHLTVPKLGDQPDNAGRLLRLGVSENLGPQQFTPRRIVKSLDRLLNSSLVAARCRLYGELCKQEDGIQKAADLLERFYAESVEHSRTIHILRPHGAAASGVDTSFA
jgi:rhamnosyltransferase subunit B